MSEIKITCKSTGEVELRPLGKYKFVRVTNATAAFQISWDGVFFQTANQNDFFGPIEGEPSQVVLKSLNGLASTVTLRYDIVPFSAQDTAQSNKPSSVRGNLDIAIGAGASGGLPACDANGYLQITNNMQLVLSGLNAAGNRRQVIIFTMASAASGSLPLNVLDANGRAFMTISPGSPAIPLVTDSPLTLSGAGGTAFVTIGEIFLTNG